MGPGLSEPVRISTLWLADIRSGGGSCVQEARRLTLTPDSQTVLTTCSGQFKASSFSRENRKALRTSCRENTGAGGIVLRTKPKALPQYMGTVLFQKAPGMRLFFIVPASVADHILPLEISRPAIPPG